MRYILIVLAVLATTVALAETAEPKKTKTTTIVTETIETDGIDDETKTEAGQTSTENELTTKFGSTATTGMSGCKTEELAKSIIADLKSDCSAWMKDQKAQLGSRYVTGTCNEECSDCAIHMKRCSVTGTVRYSKK